MPSPPAKTPHDLGDFADFLRQLTEEGFEFTVIGGMAVSSYARLLGDEVLSVDLDIYVTQETLVEFLDWAPSHDIRIVKRPQPRNIPVAFLEVAAKEVNALTAADSLPPPGVVARTARRFTLSAHGNLEVPLADPFDLLGNKLAVARDKDRPHIEILRRYVEEEVVLAFSEEEEPRARLAPARRLLEVLKRNSLPEPLADRLIELARTPVDYRFLIHRVPTVKQARRLLGEAEGRNEELVAQLEAILAKRRFEQPAGS